MRRVSVLAGLFALSAVASPAFGQATITSMSSTKTPDIDAPCRIPFEKLKDVKTKEPFPLDAAINENDKLPDHIRNRYIVADFNTTDENGTCKGVVEYISRLDELSEFPRLRKIAAARNVELATLANETPKKLLDSEEAPEDEVAALTVELEDLNNYLTQVNKYKTDHVVKARVYNGWCVGQTLNFCEIKDGKPKLVYRFVTSSSRWQQRPDNNYYAPINFIAKRNWSSDRRYTPADAKRDLRMGGGVPHIAMFENGGNPIEMPNFMHFLPQKGYAGERANGIHQIAGGLDSGGTFGAPVSLGCVRLSRYQAKLARWWTPQNAKFFIYLETNQYRNYGDAKTAKARNFINPPPVNTAGPPRQPETPSVGLFSLFR
ncbi:MAG: L,D-transpeptidase [Xanthobacteraceae bacterium]|nr:L,D-transpeptidase [Xanthobacteraceae bacterium]